MIRKFPGDEARLAGMLLLAIVLLAACGSDGSPGAQPTQTQFYDPAEGVPPTAPAPIDAEVFRHDTASALVFHDNADVRGVPPRPMLVMIYTDYCGNCIAMRPQIHALEAAYWGQIDFIYLDRDFLLNYEIITLLDVQSQPEFILMEVGQVQPIQHWRGAPAIDEMRAAIDEFLAER
jgi:thiol-disulfide isomerase/thioredoxin